MEVATGGSHVNKMHTLKEKAKGAFAKMYEYVHPWIRTPSAAAPKEASLDKFVLFEDLGYGFKAMNIPISETWRNDKYKVRKCIIRDELQIKCPCKTILLVGATGAGKSTLLDAMFNYAFGVEWKDTCRMKLVNLTPEEQERAKGGQALSQTEWVTAYTIPAQEGTTVLPYDLVIIDTPGFGDTRGIKQDDRIIDQMKYFFENSKEHGIYSVTGVCFVVQASLPRLTDNQKYIFNHILSMFGKDIAENIVTMITFADGQKPQVLASLKAAEIPHKKFFKFNNSALFANPFGKMRENTEESDDETDLTFDKMTWELGMTSFEKFFKTINSFTEKSLALSAEVLKQRDELKCHLVFVEGAIKEISQKMARFKQEEKALEKNEEKLNQNKDFEFEVEEENWTKIDSKSGAMNCIPCGKTCHHPCYVPTFLDFPPLKKLCDTFFWDFTCRNCGCHVDNHSIDNFRFVFETKTVLCTKEDIKQRYNEAKTDLEENSNIIKLLEEDYEKAKRQVMEKVENARKCLEKLRNISLRPDPITGNGYIDLLIVAEKREAKTGFEGRIDALEGLKKNVQLTEKIAKGKPDEEPLQSFIGQCPV